MRLACVFMLLVACNESQPTRQASPSPGRNVVDEDVKRALVLDAALTKLEKEIAAMEADPSANAVELAQKKDALQALRMTLENTKRRIELVRGSSSPTTP